MDERRYGVLIASNVYPNEPKLETLRCPENDVRALNEILGSKEYGAFTECYVLENRPHYEVQRKINQALKKAGKDDVVLIYYSGHGKLDPAGRLHLATVDTEIDSLEATSISVDTIRNYIDISPATKIILILDCCYSGAIGQAFLRGGTVDDQLQRVSRGRGTYILTASTDIQVAQEKEGDNNGLLTKHIVDGIREGKADLNDDGLVSMDDLYRYVYEHVRQESFQEPMKWDLNVRGDELIIARTGKSSGEIRRRKMRAKLFELADNLPDTILFKALELIAMDQNQLTEKDCVYNDLLKQLINNQLALGKFIDKWYKVELGSLSTIALEKETLSSNSTKSIASDAPSVVPEEPDIVSSVVTADIPFVNRLNDPQEISRPLPTPIQAASDQEHPLQNPEVSGGTTWKEGLPLLVTQPPNPEIETVEAQSNAVTSNNTSVRLQAYNTQLRGWRKAQDIAKSFISSKANKTRAIIATTVVLAIIIASLVWAFIPRSSQVNNDNTPLIISNITSSDVTTNEAVISWTVNKSSYPLIEYGTSPDSYISSSSNPDISDVHRVALTGLLPNTTYYYRVKARDVMGNEVSSEALTFTTTHPTLSDITPPTLNAIKVSAVTTTEATISWSTSEPSDALIDYGLSSAYGKTAKEKGSLRSSHSITLRGLDPGATYHYKVRSRDASGNESVSNNLNFNLNKGEVDTFPISGEPVNATEPCGPLFFPFNSARINGEHKACLDEVALRLQQEPRAYLIIGGYRDSSERAISLSRANNARDYLVMEKGVDSARITVRNISDSKPHSSGDPNLNRRTGLWIKR